MKDYYKLFIDLSLQQCLKNDYGNKGKVKAHNVASKKLQRLLEEMKQIDCSDVLCDLLEYKDDRVRLNAVFLCLQMNTHREKAGQTARKIIEGSSDPTIVFSAKTALQKAGENVRKDNKKQGISEAVLCAEYEAVYRYALSLCRDDTEAQDITQDTFLRAMNSVEKFEGNSSLYTWLCAIAKNLWLNNCKKYGREVMPDHIVLTEHISVEPMVQKILDKETTIEIHRFY